MSGSSWREVRVGLVLVVALVAFLGLLVLAGGGPGYLTSRKAVDVVFRDGQGIRVGSPVRVAGIDAGRVAAVDLAEVDGTLRARLRLLLPADLAGKLRVDAKITIKSGLTGQSCVDIVSSGRSAVALVPGQVLTGVETSMFDPIMEQVGLGPVERSHLSHTIAEVRQTVDAAGPRLRSILVSLQDTAHGLRETADKVRPTVESTAGHVEGLAKRLDDARIEETLKRIHTLSGHAEALMVENRPALRSTLAEVRELSASLNDIVAKGRPKVEAMAEGFNGTRARLDLVLDNARVLTAQGVDLVTQHRTDLDRTIANLKEASDYADKLVQKLYGNPFYLSPMYKPTRADVQAQEFYDVANSFLHGAKELNDSVKTLQAMQTKPMSEADRKAYVAVFNRAVGLQDQLQRTSAQLAEGIKATTPPPRR